MDSPLGALSAVRRGHFRLESGYHSDLWLDLELLCLHPEPVRRAAADLANLLVPYEVRAVCGPLNEGAFVALMVAEEMEVEFFYAERRDPGGDGLFPVEYRVPSALRPLLRGRSVAVVNDVISAGSAVRATYEDLLDCGAQVRAIAALLVLGSAMHEYAAKRDVPLLSLEERDFQLWLPSECPMCAAGTPLSL